MQKIRESITLIGIILGLTCNLYGMYFSYYFPKIPWSPVFMVIAIILISDAHNLARFKFPGWNSLLALVMTFQFIMLVYGGLSDNLTTHNFFGHGYVILFCLSIASISFTVDYSRLVFFAFLLTIPLLFLGTAMTHLDLVVGDLHYSLKQTDSDFSIEAFAVATGALINFFAGLCIQKDSFWKKIVFGLSVILSFYVIISSAKRTPVIVMLVGTLCYLWFNIKNFSRLNRMSPKLIVYIILIVVIFAVSYFNIDYVRAKVDRFAISFYTGIQALLGNVEMDQTGSATARVISRTWALDYINNQFSFINYIIGGGYFIRWLDFPILEAYLDMGIIGFVFYLYIVVVYPVGKIIQRINNRAVLFSCLICLYAIVSIFNSGHPYQWTKYIPVCILSIIWYYYKRTTNESKSLDNNNNA